MTMSASLLTVVVDCTDPRQLTEFWSVALAYEVHRRNPDEYECSDPSGSGFPMYFMKVPEPKAGKNRLHVDVLTEGPLDAEVQRLVAAGAELVEVRRDPATHDHPDTWAVLLDPEGNEFCVTSTATFTGWS
jgi:hypothetical protein